MELGKQLSLKDFFNYFISGSIWIADTLLIFLLLPSKPDISTFTTIFSSDNAFIQSFILSIGTIIIPYSLGFALSPLGSFVTRCWCNLRGDPYQWVADYRNNGKKYKGKRLSWPIIKKSAILANYIFDFDVAKFKKNPNLYFYQIRAYVANKGGAASELAVRSLDLANLAESLLIPFPLFISILFYYITSLVVPQGNAWMICFLGISILIGIGIFLAIVQRYMKLREHWIKHTYRAFVILAIADQRGKENVSETHSKDTDETVKNKQE